MAVVSRKAVQPCSAAWACSSWMNFLNSVSDAALCGGSEIVVHEYDTDKVKSPKATNAWKAEQAEYAPLLMTDTLPVRVLDVRRELAKPGISDARRSRLELAERRTTATVESLGAEPKAL